MIKIHGDDGLVAKHRSEIPPPTDEEIEKATVVTIMLFVDPLVERAKYSLFWTALATKAGSDYVMYHLGADPTPDSKMPAHVFLASGPFKVFMRALKKDVMAGKKTILPAPTHSTKVGNRTYYNFVIASARVMRNYRAGRIVCIDMHGLSVMNIITYGAVCTFFEEADRNSYYNWLMKDAPPFKEDCTLGPVDEATLKYFVGFAESGAKEGMQRVLLKIPKKEIDKYRKE
jgi:hypothetical protein